MNEGSARILHPPADIWNLELRVRRPVIARKLGLDRDAQLVLGAVNAKHAVHGQIRSNARGDFSVEPVRRKTISGYRALSRTSWCIFRSRPSLPVFPLVASNTTSPEIAPLAGSNCNSHCLLWNEPCTVCKVALSLMLAAVCAGSQRKVSGG